MEEQSLSPERRQSDDGRPQPKTTETGNAAANEAKGGTGAYIVSARRNPQSNHLTLCKRVFQYADRKSWALNIVAFVAAIAAGSLLPLMDLVFGKFVTTFTGFATGATTPAQYRSEVTKFTLYFIYLFIAKFSLVYIHSVSTITLGSHVGSQIVHGFHLGMRLHCGDPHYQGTSDRLHQACLAAKHRILRLRLGRLRDDASHDQWQ